MAKLFEAMAEVGGGQQLPQKKLAERRGCNHRDEIAIAWYHDPPSYPELLVERL
jgi:hypothetical protein